MHAKPELHSDVKTHLSTLSQPVAIERIAANDLPPDRFTQHYQRLGLPFVLTGLLQPEWDWHLEYLCDQLGDREFVLRYYGRDRYQQDKRQWTSIGSGVPPQTRSFQHYAQLLHSGEAHDQDIYLAKCPISATPLVQTNVVQTIQTYCTQLGLTRPASSLNLWVGAGGHVECLHYDPTDGTLIQLHGSKRVLLFPPSQTANLYPYPVYVHLRHGLKLRSWFSQVYPDQPDLYSFPKLQAALDQKYEVILEQGEILYIPAGWWHEVTALGSEMVCSLNRFWRVYPTPRAMLSWNRWRAYLGSLCAMPNVAWSLGMALCSQQRQQKLQQIWQMF